MKKLLPVLLLLPLVLLPGLVAARAARIRDQFE